MLRSMSLVVATAALMVSGTSLAAERTVRLAVDGMWCAGCSYVVKKTLAGVRGVTEVDVSMADRSALVTFDGAKTEVAALTEATAGVGFPSRVAE